MSEPMEKYVYDTLCLWRTFFINAKEGGEVGVVAIETLNKLWHRLKDQPVASGAGYKALREAWMAGVCWQREVDSPTMYVQSEAKRRYPPPTVTRPRVVTCRETPWRVVNDRLEYRSIGGNWNTAKAMQFHPDREHIELWADLLANPTETVPADE